MKPHKVLTLPMILLIFGTGDRTHAGVMIEALDRERFGASSAMTFYIDGESYRNFSGGGDIAAGAGVTSFSLRGSWQTERDTQAFMNPTYLFCTRSYGRFLAGGGFGYDYDETRQQASSSSFDLVGPGISPFYVIGEANKRTIDLEWSRRHSFIINMNGLFLYKPHRAFIAGLEASYMPRQGFRYHEEYQDPPSVALARYFDYNRAAFGASISGVLGYWREAVWQHRRWSFQGRAEWNFRCERSQPRYLANVGSPAFTSMPSGTQTVQYGGERNMRNDFGLKFAAGDVNPDRFYWMWAKRAPWRATFFSVNDITLEAYYRHGNDLFTYVNKWPRYDGDEWGTTDHRYVSSEIEGTLSPRLRWYFMRYAFMDVDGEAHAYFSDRRTATKSRALFGAGIRVPFGKNCLADVQISFAECTASALVTESFEMNTLVKTPEFRFTLMIIDLR